MNFSRRVTNQCGLVDTIRHETSYPDANSARKVFFVTVSNPSWLEEFSALGDFDFVGHESDADRSDRISALLGTERNVAVIELGQTPNLGLLAALAGTIKGGGALVLGIKPNRQSHSCQRLITLLQQSANEHPEHFIRVDTVASSNKNAGSPPTSASHPTISRSHKASNPYKQDTNSNSKALEEQNTLFNKTISHLSSRTTACIAITGRRGTGKSSLLARLAEHFSPVHSDVVLTASNKSALASWHQQFGEVMNHYLAPENATMQTGRMLFVDEAASLPLSIIQRLLENYDVVILGSTVEGYESAGRALELRWVAEQSRSNHDFLKLTPCEPWRWVAHDPLEKFVSRLLINPSDGTTECAAPSAAGEYRIRRIEQRELASNEPLLTSVYRLLHLTHYQTSTKDLEHLLDAPSLQCWVQVQRHSDCVVAVLLLELEGELGHTLHEAIVSKQRRLHNQLLPQLLAQYANSASALGHRYGRVLRIAVAPELRRSGLATALLNAVVESANTHAMGASFAADDISLAFWESNGYQLFHKGQRENPRTGKRAVAVLRCFEPVTQHVLDTALLIHKDNESSDNNVLLTEPVDNETALLKRFAAGQRSLHDSRAAVRRLGKTHNLPIERTGSQSRKQHELILRNNVEKALVEN